MKTLLKTIFLCTAVNTLALQVDAQTKKVAKKPVKKAVVKKPSTKNTATKGVLPSSIAYQLFPGGIAGVKAKTGDMITMHIKVKAGDSTLFDSYALNEGKPVPAQIAKPQYNGDIMEVLTMLAAGDSAVFVVHQDSVMRNGMKPPYLKPADKVNYFVKMVTIKDEAAYKAEQAIENEKAMSAENKLIDDYIAKKGLKKVQKTVSGLRYIITDYGKGETAKPGVKATMNYTGKFLDDKPFDSNVLPEFNHVSPFEFTLGQGQVIKGWDEGIQLLNKGSKATLIIPSPLGYGSRDSGPIKANSVLVFDVELVDFK
jgi:FKBP-type peptidyl-prolyl cis-trans isomerase FkpA